MLTAPEIRQLEQLVVAGAPLARGGPPGLRRALHRGPGLEFEEYRPYHAGDDPRLIDWTVEARLQQLVVRVARDAGSAHLHVLVDASASMGLGRPSKLATAARLAAMLCYVAAVRRESASVALFDHAVRRHLPAADARTQIFRTFELLGRARASGRSALDRALVEYGAAVRGPGLAVILSDFFGPDTRLEGVDVLRQRGLTPALVQIVAPDELDPGIAGPTLLRDVEDADAPPVVIDEMDVPGFQARLTEHGRALARFCLSRGLPWMRTTSNVAFADLISSAERAELLVRYS
jgi:uncharacterized protein (DUF58 family)